MALVVAAQLVTTILPLVPGDRRRRKPQRRLRRGPSQPTADVKPTAAARNAAGRPVRTTGPVATPVEDVRHGGVRAAAYSAAADVVQRNALVPAAAERASLPCLRAVTRSALVGPAVQVEPRAAHVAPNTKARPLLPVDPQVPAVLGPRPAVRVATGRTAVPTSKVSTGRVGLEVPLARLRAAKDTARPATPGLATPAERSASLRPVPLADRARLTAPPTAPIRASTPPAVHSLEFQLWDWGQE